MSLSGLELPASWTPGLVLRHVFDACLPYTTCMKQAAGAITTNNPGPSNVVEMHLSIRVGDL